MVELDELVKHSMNGDKEAFTNLIELMQDDLYKIARIRLYNTDDIDDAVQNTIISAYKSLDKLNNPTVFRAWIIKILVNECNMIYRQNHRRFMIFNKSIQSSNIDSFYDTEFISIEYKAEIKLLFKILNNDERLCIILRYMYDYSIKEIADILGSSPNTIKSRIARAKKKMQKYRNDTDDIARLSNKKSHNFGIDKVIISIGAILVLTTGVSFAKDIIKFFENIFNLTSINIKNDSIVDAINDKNYIQNIDMNYIAINEDYKIKVDYLMLDDINLYMVFNLYSKKDIDENIRFSIWDLIITDGNGNCLYNAVETIQNDSFFSIPGWKEVITSDNEKRELFFLMTNGMPNIEKLNIKFTRLALYDKKNSGFNDVEINCNCDFNIDIDNKFKNREIIQYSTISPANDKYEIEKCIATETGLYLLFKTVDMNVSFQLLDINVPANINALDIDSNNYYYILAQFNVSKNELESYESIKISDSTNILVFNKIK